MNNMKGALGKPSSASYGYESNRDVDDLYSSFADEFEGDNPLKVSPLTRDEEDMLERSVTEATGKIRSGDSNDSNDSNEDQQPATLIKVTDPNHFSPPPTRMQQFKSDNIDVSQSAATVSQRSIEAAAKAMPTSLPKSPFTEGTGDPTTSGTGIKSGDGDNKAENVQSDESTVANAADASVIGNSSPGSPDFLRKMTSWFERSKNSPATSTLRKPSVPNEAKTTEPQSVVPVATEAMSSSGTASPSPSVSVTEKIQETSLQSQSQEPTLGDIYTDRGIIGSNPMLKNKSKAARNMEAKKVNSSSVSSFEDTPLVDSGNNKNGADNNIDDDSKGEVNNKNASSNSSSSSSS